MSLGGAFARVTSATSTGDSGRTLAATGSTLPSQRQARFVAILASVMSGVAQPTAEVVPAKGPSESVPLVKSENNTPTELTEETLRERLALNSPELVDQLFLLVQNLIATETGRQTRLDAKATSLLTAAGLALTVTTGFVGATLARPDLKWPAPVLGAACVLFAIGVILALLAAIWAVRALRVRDSYRTAHEDALFNPALLLEANASAPDESGPSQVDDRADKEDAQRRVFGLMEYRKHLIPHYWSILCQHRAVHEGKARLIRDGQLLFLFFLGDLILVCILLAIGVVSRG